MEGDKEEILTLSIGNYANFVAGHYWNLLKAEANEDIDNSALWKKQRALWLSIDAKGAYSNQRKHRLRNTAFDNFDSSPKKVDKLDISHLWGGDLQIYNFSSQDPLPQQPNVIPSKPTDRDFQQWSDYLDIEWSPKNLQELQSVKFEIEEFDIYDKGLEALQNQEESRRITDAVQNWQEECDRVKLVQVFADLDSSFSGVAEKVLEYLRDEYHKTPIVVYGACNGQGSQTLAYNKSRSIFGWSEYASMVVPMDAHNFKSNFVNCRLGCNYQTSYVLASNVEALSAPMRRSSVNFHPYAYVNSLVLTNKLKVVSNGFSMPFPPYAMSPQKLFATKGLNFTSDLSFSVLKKVENLDRSRSQHLVVRGCDSFVGGAIQLQQDFDNPSKIEKNVSILYEARNLERLMEIYCLNNSPSTTSNCFDIPSPLFVPECSPDIFKGLDENGKMRLEALNEYAKIKSVSCFTHLKTSKSTGEGLRDLAQQFNFLKKQNIAKEISHEYHEEIREGLIQMSEEY